MDEIATKAMIIGVSIFVTLLIVTIIIFEFTEISSLYEITGETNITFEERLDEFNKYRDENNQFNGLDVKNTLSKYKGVKNVKVCIGDTNPVCDDEITIPEENYTDKYKSTFKEEKGIYIITFEYLGS